MFGARPQRLARRVNADPVIHEAQVRLRLDFGHVASHARRPPDRRSVLRLRVASQAALVVFFRRSLNLRVRFMAGQAGESAPAFTETTALAEVQRLVTCVPSVVPIGGFTGGGRLAVAATTKFVERPCSQRLRISDGSLSARQPDMFFPWPMAGLTSHPWLEGHDLKSLAEPQRSGGMALEAA